MKNGNGKEKALREEISGLQEKLVELTSRLQMLEGRDDNGNAVVQVNSRRDLLKLAGAMAAGAAGAVVLRPIGAGATAGNPVVLGHDASAGNNDSNATTHLGPTLTPTVTTPSPLVQIEGQGLPTGANFPANPNAHSHQGAVDQPISMPLLLAVAPYGVFPTVTNPGPPVTTTPVYPGLAPVQGVGGPVNDAGLHVSEGVDGWAHLDLSDVSAGTLLAYSAGVSGSSDNGIGVVGSGSTDLAAFGAGYIAQVSITDSNGNKIAGPPPAPVYNFEQARDVNGALWLSTPAGDWRRMNTPIPITPFRIYDSRPNARPAGSFTDIQIAGVNGIPADAIGVFGNLTALSPAADGFLNMYPSGTALGQVNTLNYTRGVSALSNHAMVALGSNGKVTVFVSQNGSTNFLFDVQGYLR